MEKITEEDYNRETSFYKNINTSRVYDKNNNMVHLCATVARYFMCIISSKEEKYYELTFKEFNAKEHELLGETIYRISEVEFKDIQGFRNKPHLFNIVFFSENFKNFCRMYIWFNKNGVFARGSDIYDELTGYFKVSDNLNKFSIEKILKRLKKHYPRDEFKYTINF